MLSSAALVCQHEAYEKGRPPWFKGRPCALKLLFSRESYPHGAQSNTIGHEVWPDGLRLRSVAAGLERAS